MQRLVSAVGSTRTSWQHDYHHPHSQCSISIRCSGAIYTELLTSMISIARILSMWYWQYDLHKSIESDDVSRIYLHHSNTGWKEIYVIIFYPVQQSADALAHSGCRSMKFCPVRHSLLLTMQGIAHSTCSMWPPFRRIVQAATSVMTLADVLSGIMRNVSGVHNK